MASNAAMRWYCPNLPQTYLTPPLSIPIFSGIAFNHIMIPNNCKDDFIIPITK